MYLSSSYVGNLSPTWNKIFPVDLWSVQIYEIDAYFLIKKKNLTKNLRYYLLSLLYRSSLIKKEKLPTLDICSQVSVLSSINDYASNRRKLTSKISKPAISSTPIKCCLFCFVSKVSLHFLTNHLNSLSNMALDMAPTEYATWSLLRPCVTNSLPTLILGFSKFL